MWHFYGILANRLPLCFRQPNRIFLLNGKHPRLWLMLTQWRNHVMVLAFLASLKLCETSIGQHLSPRWGHVILVDRYPVLTTFLWCGRQTDRRTDKWLPKFKFLGWIKNQILLAMRLSSRRLAHPWSSAKTYLNLKTRKCLFYTLTLLEKSECSEKSKLQTIFGYLTALQLLHDGRGCQFPRKSEQRQAKLYT